MSGVNQAILVGYLGNDPDVHYTADGRVVVNLSLATSDKWRDRPSGEQKMHTEWHKVICFNRLGEIAKNYLKKGALIYVEGKLQTGQWRDKDGVERHTTQIAAKRLEMFGGRSDPQSEVDPVGFDEDLPF